MKAGNPEKYKGLEMSDAAKNLLYSDPKKFASYCNGVGSRVGFWNKLAYHFIPNTIGLVNVTPASDIHDVEYTVPFEFESLALAKKAFDEANMRLYNNLVIIIERHGRDSFFYEMRMWVAKKYYEIVSSSRGETSFYKGKKIAGKNHG